MNHFEKSLFHCSICQWLQDTDSWPLHNSSYYSSALSLFPLSPYPSILASTSRCRLRVVLATLSFNLHFKSLSYLLCASCLTLLSSAWLHWNPVCSIASRNEVPLTDRLHQSPCGPHLVLWPHLVLIVEGRALSQPHPEALRNVQISSFPLRGL